MHHWRSKYDKGVKVLGYQAQVCVLDSESSQFKRGLGPDPDNHSHDPSMASALVMAYFVNLLLKYPTSHPK